MEVEAKFIIPERETVERLGRIVRLGTFVPGQERIDHIHDVYLDTANRDLYGHGLACRRREGKAGSALEIKGLGQAEHAVHERQEYTLALAPGEPISPALWPDEGIWSELRLLVGQQKLETLFVVDQVRSVRELSDGRRVVADMSIDEAEIRAQDRRRSFVVLEIELKGEGTRDDLAALVKHLTETWMLVPDASSKFEHGLNLIEGDADQAEADQPRLLPTERAQLEHLVTQTSQPQVRKRAQLLLEWDRGTPVRELGAHINGSRSWVYRWLHRFRQQRMAIFADSLLVVGEPEPAAARRRDTSNPQMTVDEMVRRFQVDIEHARNVADHALALFDATASFHKLDAGRRHLMQVMGMLHDVGVDSNPDHAHTAGRDTILDHEIAGLGEIEQRMLAAAVYLSRKPMTRKRLKSPVVSSLPRGIREDTLILAALLRIADRLSRETQVEIEVSPAAVRLALAGPTAEADAVRMQARADLWEQVFPVPLFVAAPALAKIEPVLAPDAPPAAAQPVSPGVLATDWMSQAGYKVLRFYWQHLLAHEAGTRAGTNIEELHDMRVATRRIRAAINLFGDYFKPGAIRPYVAGLRRTGRALGAVRDLDILIARANAYLETLPPERHQDLEPLLSVWRAQREEAREEMLAYLNGPQYAELVDTFAMFLETPGAGAKKVRNFPPPVMQVRHVLPARLYVQWAQVQSFAPLLDGAPTAVLHALRIECKRLRYALEFFVEVLGPEAVPLISELVQVQDHLGSLNDAGIANRMISDLLFGEQDGGERIIAPGVVAYLADRQRELQDLIHAFPQVWDRFNRTEVRQWLAMAIAPL